jgi:RHS repeat-associated protein
MYYHAASGINLTLHRAYDADLGRWPNRDPLGERGGLNLYDYVGNNPINRFDRFGLQPVDVEPPSQGTYGAWNDVSGRDLSDINNEMNHYEPGESGGDPISSLLSLFQSTPPPTPAQIQWDLQYGYTQPPPGQTWLIPARPQNPPKPQQKSCPNGGAFYAPPTSGNINAPPTLIIP